jgi:hypothetical protein
MTDIIEEIVAEGMRMFEEEIRTETVYTAYFLSTRGREEIERYGAVEEAIRDILELWPEDDDGDVVIEDNLGNGMAYFARSDRDPRIVHVYFMNDGMTGIDHVESYRCEYEPALGGSVRTVIKRLG